MSRSRRISSCRRTSHMNSAAGTRSHKTSATPNQARMARRTPEPKVARRRYENRASASSSRSRAARRLSRRRGYSRSALSATRHSHPERERLRRKVSSAELAYVFWMSDNEPAQHSPNYGGWASFEVEIRARRYARCVQAAQAAVDAGNIEEAKDWIAEGRVVSFASPELDELERQISTRSESPVAPPC